MDMELELEMEGIAFLLETDGADYNKIDYDNDSLAVIKAKQAAQARARQGPPVPSNGGTTSNQSNTSGYNKVDYQNDNKSVAADKQAAQDRARKGPLG